MYMWQYLQPRFIFFSSNVSKQWICLSQWLLQPAVLKSEMVVSVWARPRGDWAQLLGGRPSLVFTAWRHPYTFTCPCIAHHPPPPSSFTTPPPTPHPRLLLCMNNARSLLNRRYQHAAACFIHTKVRQISPRRCPDPWAARRPQRHQQRVCSLSLLDLRIPAEECDPTF